MPPKLPWNLTKSAGAVLTGVGLATMGLALSGMPIGRFPRGAVVEWGDVAPSAPSRGFVVLLGVATAVPGIALLAFDRLRKGRLR